MKIQTVSQGELLKSDRIFHIQILLGVPMFYVRKVMLDGSLYGYEFGIVQKNETIPLIVSKETLKQHVLENPIQVQHCMKNARVALTKTGRISVQLNKGLDAGQHKPRELFTREAR